LRSKYFNFLAGAQIPDGIVSSKDNRSELIKFGFNKYSELQNKSNVLFSLSSLASLREINKKHNEPHNLKT
jgi:hypothetical protein